MNPLVKSARDHRVGYDEVEALESRQTRKEIPVRGSQPMTIGRMIADGDHEVSPRASRGAAEQRRPQQDARRRVRSPRRASRNAGTR